MAATSARRNVAAIPCSALERIQEDGLGLLVTAGARRTAFVALACFVLMAPSASQVFGYQSIWLRPWVMYSGVGVGILKGQFTISSTDGSMRTLTPLEVLGLPRYPVVRYYLFPHRVREDGEIRRFAARFCEDLPDGERLSFAGHVGTREGWRPLEADDICASLPAAVASDQRAEAAQGD